MCLCVFFCACVCVCVCSGSMFVCVPSCMCARVCAGVFVCMVECTLVCIQTRTETGCEITHKVLYVYDEPAT